MSEIPFRFEHKLIFVSIILHHQGRSLTFEKCIVDTGSAGTTFETSLAEGIGLLPAPESKIRFLSAVGGREAVYTRTVETIQIGDEMMERKIVEFGDLETKFHIDGIIGNDILRLFQVKIYYRKHLLVLQRCE